AQDVGRQQVRRELDALKPRGNRLRNRRGGERLGHAVHAFEQDVPAAGARPAPRRRKRDRRKESREQPSNQFVLADDELADFLLERRDDAERLLGAQPRRDGALLAWVHSSNHNAPPATTAVTRAAG